MQRDFTAGIRDFRATLANFARTERAFRSRSHELRGAVRKSSAPRRQYLVNLRDTKVLNRHLYQPVRAFSKVDRSISTGSRELDYRLARLRFDDAAYRLVLRKAHVLVRTT